MIIQTCAVDSADAVVLVGELSATLAALTGSGGAFAREEVRLFVVARAEDGGLLGCGALQHLRESVGEVKRMYARPGTQGVGAALLTHLEDAAAAQGYTALWLETRHVNTRAVAFYLKHGYQPIANYGKYAGRPEAACFGKELGVK